MIKLDIDEQQLGQRADVLIAGSIPQLSRGFVKQLAKQSKISFNDQPIDVGYKFKKSGMLILDYDIAQLDKVPSIELPIIYEDNDLIVINKPSGVISHARGRYWDEPSVASFIRNRINPAVIPKNNQDQLRFGIVHRLDRATSGVIVCAKNANALKNLQHQFSQRQVLKTYLALVEKHDLPEQGQIDKPIARNPKKPSVFQVHVNGKPALTDFKVLKSGKKFLQLELQPKTGRTHQIRVHLASINCPIIGDQLYGGLPAERLMLHASKIELIHPSNNKRVSFSAELPKEFNQLQ